MTSRPARRWFAIFTFLLSATATPAAWGADGEAHENVYVTGPEVRVENPVAGDLVAAAGRVSVEQPVSGDAILAGGSVELRANIGDDLRAAAAVLTLGGTVGGEALLAGGSISTSPNFEVRGRTWIGAKEVVLAGKFLDGVKAYANQMIITGEIHGPVSLTGERIEVLAGARIFGNIDYSSPNEIVVDPRARITGTVTRSSGSPKPPAEKSLFFTIVRPLLLFGLLAAGALLLALFPRYATASAQLIGTAPFKSLGLGTALFFSVPPVVVLLIITIIGLPVAVVAAAVYAAALLAGYLIAALFIGQRTAALAGRSTDTFASRLLFLAIALIALALLRAIPFAGTLVILLALLLGLGAMMQQAFSNYAAKK